MDMLEFADHEIRVIAPDGEQVGILPVERALEIAEEQGLDVEVVLREPVEQVVRLAIEARAPNPKGPDRSITLTLNAHGEPE